MASILSPMDISYCEGARLLQDSRAEIGTILLQRPNGGLICQHCYLVVADANDVRAISPDQDWPLLVSCHVQACGSLHDRKAAYSCYACLERGKLSVEPTMVALREHLHSCELIKLSEHYRKRKDVGRLPPVPKSSSRRSRVEFQPAKGTEAPPRPSHPPQYAEAAQSSNSARKPQLNPFTHTQGSQSVASSSSAAPVQPAHPPPGLPTESNPPLPSRPKASAATNAERMYTPPSIRQPQQPIPQNTPQPNTSDIFNVPGGFPAYSTAPTDSRASSLQDYTPTVPRRKEVRMETQGPPPDKLFPTAPARAPPAPPVLSPPAPPPYYQGKGGSDSTYQPSPVSSHDARLDSVSGADAVKIQQLVALGIPRMDAEYLLNRTGGDVNAAAELQLSEMGSLAGPVRATDAQAAHPSPLASSPVERRNRRSK